jgi:hypothetical protein
MRVAAPEEGAGTTRRAKSQAVTLRQSNGTASGVLRSAHRRGIRRSSGEVPRLEGPVPSAWGKAAERGFNIAASVQVALSLALLERVRGAERLP